MKTLNRPLRGSTEMAVRTAPPISPSSCSTRSCCVPSAAATVFGPQFFPQVSETAGTLASFATFGIGFIASEYQRLARPGVVFRKLEGVTPYLSLGVAYQPDDASPAVRVFLGEAERIGKSVR